MEEGREGDRVLMARLGEVAHGGVAEEHREHRPRGLHHVRHPGGGQVLAHRGADGGRDGVEVGVDLGGREPQRGQAAVFATGFPESVPAW